MKAFCDSCAFSWLRIGEDIYAERKHRPAMRRVQAPQLHDEQEQEEDYDAARVQEVLSRLPQAHAS
jgi:hypothetical protein